MASRKVFRQDDLKKATNLIRAKKSNNTFLKLEKNHATLGFNILWSMNNINHIETFQRDYYFEKETNAVKI